MLLRARKVKSHCGEDFASAQIPVHESSRITADTFAKTPKLHNS